MHPAQGENEEEESADDGRRNKRVETKKRGQNSHQKNKREKKTVLVCLRFSPSAGARRLFISHSTVQMRVG